MSKVAICFVVRDSFVETKLFVQDLFKSIESVDARLLVLDWGSTDERTIDVCKEVVKQTDGSMGSISIATPLGQVYDAITALIDPEDEYIVFLKPNLFLSRGWLLNMIYHYGAIDNSGVIGVRALNDPCEISFAASNENASNFGSDMLPVWRTKTNIIETPAFISRKNFERLGGFTRAYFKEDFYFEELSYRASIFGMQNYYVTESACVRADLKNDYLFPPVTREGLKEFKAHIDTIFSNNAINQL